MKMRFLHSKQANRLPRRLAPLVLLVLVVLLALFSDQLPRPLSSVGHAIAQPMWHVRDTVTLGFTRLTTSQQEKKELIAAHEALLAELAVLKSEIRATHALEADNRALRALLERTSTEDGLLATTILTHSVTAPDDAFIIDLGLDDGVRDGMLVRSADGGAVGFVARALARTAIVTRFSSPDTVTQAIIQGTSTLHTKLEGWGAGTMVMRIPRDIPVDTGDPVLAPSFGTIPLGYVALVASAPEDALQTLYVESPVNPWTLRFLVVDTMHFHETPQTSETDS